MADEVTFSDLVSSMLEKFEENEVVADQEGSDFDPASPQVLLLVCKWYGKDVEVAKMMVSLYSASAELSDDADSAAVAEATQFRKTAIARVFRYWMDHYPEDFNHSSPLLEHLSALQEIMASAQDTELLELVSSDTLPKEPRWFQKSLNISSHQSLRRPSLGFDSTSASDLANIMSCIDFHLFHKIPVYEFCVYARAARPTEETPRIEECIQLFNGLTTWVVCNILRELTIVKRAVIVEKFVDCTKYLRKNHCYNTLLAVVGGLNHFSIRRLTQTWSKVDRGRRTELEAMTQFFSSHSNYSTYRQANALDSDFRIPVLGILLKDLVAIDSQGKDYSPSQHINSVKYRLLWTTLSAIRIAQMCMTPFTVDKDHMRILRVAISQTNMNDNALEELSLAREPRQRGNSKESISVDALPKFSEWAAGRQSSLDTDTLNKHVKQMVEAVFRAYDTDNSGSISTEEFDAISSNFPFIECFSVLDQDNDGMISYDELLSYFQSANSQLRERFTHLFAEHTFIGTTVCEHCKGMMKGIVKQGVRCKDCGISCHKHCKDHVVVDCSKRKEKKKAKVRDQRSANPSSDHASELYCDDDMSLKERLSRAEAARDALSAENSELLAKLAEANAKIHQLQSHIAVIRQHTIGFILEQMNTLSPTGTESGTEV